MDDLIQRLSLNNVLKNFWGYNPFQLHQYFIQWAWNIPSEMGGACMPSRVCDILLAAFTY